MTKEFIEVLAALLTKLNIECSMSNREQKLLHLLELNSEIAYLEYKRKYWLQVGGV